MAVTQVCPKCEGTGYVTFERNGVSCAERCECYDSARRRGVADRSLIPPEYSGKSFDNFDCRRGDNPVLGSALAGVMVRVKAFSREFPAVKPPGLLLIGSPGIGKTH